MLKIIYTGEALMLFNRHIQPYQLSELKAGVVYASNFGIVFFVSEDGYLHLIRLESNGCLVANEYAMERDGRWVLRISKRTFHRADTVEQYYRGLVNKPLCNFESGKIETVQNEEIDNGEYAKYLAYNKFFQQLPKSLKSCKSKYEWFR
jgi:hypothetical protein